MSDVVLSLAWAALFVLLVIFCATGVYTVTGWIVEAIW